MKAIVLANDGISPSGKEALENGGFEVRTEKVEQENLIDYINEHKVEVLLVRSATTARKDMIDSCPSLKMIGRGGVGMDNIDVEYGRSKGLIVFNTPGASSQAVAELAMTHAYSIARGLHDANRQMPTKGATEFGKLKKKYAKGMEMRGSKMGIIGFGRIGQNLAKYAIGNGMEVLAANAAPTTVEIALDLHGVNAVATINTVSTEEVLANADVISLHVPAQKDGALIGKAEFDKMKDGAILINLARGGVVDEDAMLEALNSGKLAGAGVDVFVGEPSPRQDILEHPNVSVTPHIGAATTAAQSRIGVELADQIMEHYAVEA